MFLQYGISDDGQLVYIDQIPRGMTALKCPYCTGGLIAKKGDIKKHHFAHAGETCREADRDESALAIPGYDNFNLHYSGKELRAIREVNETGYSTAVHPQRLIQRGIAVYNDYSDEYKLTHEAKIPIGQLSCHLFNEVQDKLIRQRHDELEAAADLARRRHPVDYPARLRDLQIFRAQLRRIYTTTLYFLEIDSSAGKLYKIGVTARDIAARVIEIERELPPHLGEVKIKVLDTWEHRGNVELYFKHRYAEERHPIGNLTEYFRFDEIKKVLSYDLRRMKPRQLDPFERDIITGQLSALEQRIAADEIESRRRAGIRAGLQRAKMQGEAIGRPADDPATLLAKHPHVVEAIRDGLSLRAAAAKAGVAINTVRKVKAALDGDPSL